MRWLRAAEAGPALAGGKGAQLGRLARYGLPVPEGFVMSTVALAMDEQLAAVARRAGSGAFLRATLLAQGPLHQDFDTQG